ncbi:response regulator [Fibrella sp. HMF5335]|uniref:Response regulator n=1 Tax=Fibrella rubiginis TaxID=2817060 RepID=A0A939GB96_9BACT|nr:response regulator [Fibrella rubiginis]MBO0935704.1 response regulator [Fibrella rubiginis]
MLSLLLIEDDQDDIDLFRYALGREAIAAALTIVMQGDEALPTLKKNSTSPDLIVMDLNLPIIHGRDVLAQIRQDSIYRRVPILVLTTSSSVDERNVCMALGADAFVTKPTSIEGFKALAGTIRQLAQA